MSDIELDLPINSHIRRDSLKALCETTEADLIQSDDCPPTSRSIKKSVSFHSEVMVHYYIDNRLNRQASSSRSRMPAQNNLQTTIRFKDFADVWFIPNRADLKDFLVDIWYNKNEFKVMQIDAYQELMKNENNCDYS